MDLRIELCPYFNNCNLDCILFAKLSWPGNSEGHFGLRVKLPSAHLFTKNGGGFTLSF